MKITLPWPPSILSPNVKKHWRVKQPFKVKYRDDCFLLASQVKPVFPEGKINLYLTFFPPDARHRDDDNIISSFKSGRDGLAKAWGVNDRRFKCIPEIGEIRRPFGAVEVSVG